MVSGGQEEWWGVNTRNTVRDGLSAVGALFSGDDRGYYCIGC